VFSSIEAELVEKKAKGMGKDIQANIYKMEAKVALFI
jgi:hypothetical protein